VPYRPGAERAFLKEVYETTEELTRNTLHLMDRVDWEFFMVVYRDTDEMHHFFWKHMDSTHPAHDPAISAPYRDAILEYYQKIDATIGRLLAKAGPEATVWIMSDHGGGPLYQDVFLNEWLRQKNYLTIHSEQQPTGKARNALGRLGVTRANVSSMLRRLRLGRLERWLKDQLGDRIEVLPRSQRAEFPQAIDWSRTQAYSFGYHGQVYLNLQGREPQGIVPPGVYEAVREKIAADLLGMIDPRDGKPVVDQVYRREDIYHGPFLDYAPDLTLVMRNYSYVTRQGYEFSDHPGSIFSSPLTHESGSHRMDGVVVAYGEGIKALGKLSKGANLVDLAPTLLHLCSCSIPAMMDGHVLADWLTTSHPPVIETDAGEATISPAELPTFSEAEEAEMINRLKNLGYLE
jgi:predicted AlkP superfamily phosphohydrolase/phosphomutase